MRTDRAPPLSLYSSPYIRTPVLPSVRFTPVSTKRPHRCRAGARMKASAEVRLISSDLDLIKPTGPASGEVGPVGFTRWLEL